MNIDDIHTAIKLQYGDRDGAVENQYAVTLTNDDAGDLRKVLDAMAQFLRAAGFTYVVTVGAELDDGRVTFGDDVPVGGDIEDDIADIEPLATPFYEAFAR